MKERPILFSGPMVRALLEGRKTQTRRLVKPQPKRIGWYMQDDKPGQQFDWLELDEDGDPIDSSLRCPYGAPGDRLWVKEAHQIFPTYTSAVVIYREDGSQVEHTDQHAMLPGVHVNMGNPLSEYTSFNERFPERWRPSIHMPRAASRLTLEVTGVRVERVQDISEADACAEGVERCGGFKDSFRTLWDSINGGPWVCWDDNPWVWVVSFKRVDG